jgi:hypothetical protein
LDRLNTIAADLPLPPRLKVQGWMIPQQGRPMIVTSSFFATLPPHVVRLSIARRTPDADSGLPVLRQLAPGEWFRSVDEDEYRRRYLAQLAQLDARAVVDEIEVLAAGRPAALLCWERPRDGQFCHRGFVSAWLFDELGLEVFEHGLRGEGCGHRHPKLPARYRAAPAQGSLF